MKRRSDHRRQAIKTLVLVVPFTLLFGALVAFAPALREWSGAMQHGGDYRRFEIDRFDLFVPKEFPVEMVGELARKLPLFERELLNILGRPVGDTRIKVHLFETMEELTRFTLVTTFKKDIVHNDGFYNPLKNEIAIRLTGDERVDVAGILHEATHALGDLSNNGRAWRPWLSEGLATFLARSSFADGSVRLGGFDAPLLRHLQKQDIPLKVLLTAPPAAFQSEGNVSYYAKAHLLVSFLMEDAPERREKFIDYLRSEPSLTAAGGVALFEKAFGDPEMLETELQTFARKILQ